MCWKRLITGAAPWAPMPLSGCWELGRRWALPLAAVCEEALRPQSLGLGWALSSESLQTGERVCVEALWWSLQKVWIPPPQYPLTQKEAPRLVKPKTWELPSPYPSPQSWEPTS